MNVRPIDTRTPVARELWRAMPAEMKLVFLASGRVVLDEDGLPRVADEVLATTLHDVESALGLR